MSKKEQENYDLFRSSIYDSDGPVKALLIPLYGYRRAGSAGISLKGPWCLVQGNFNSTARIGEVMMRKPHCATCGEVLFMGSVDSLFRMFPRNAVETDGIFRVYTFSLQEQVSEPVFWRTNVLLINVFPVEWKICEQLLLWIFEIPMNKMNSVKFCK